GRAAPANTRRNRGQGHHRRPIRSDPIGWTAVDAPVMALVGPLQPADQLAVEVCRAGEAAAGQERGLQVAVGPLHQPFSLWIGWPALQDPDAEGAPEGLGITRQLRPTALPRAD